MKVLSSIISLSLYQTVVSAIGKDEDPVSSFISQRRNLLLKNAAKYGVTRSSISSKAPDAKAKQNVKAILSSLHGKQGSDGSACSDAYEKMYSVFNPDLYVFDDSDYTMIDGINAVFFSSSDESKFNTFSSTCEALDGRVEFINLVADNCYDEKYDEDFNPTGELDYLSPLGSLYHQPDCTPNACSTDDEVVNTLETFYYAGEYGDKCKFSIEISDQETTEEKIECIQATVDIFFDETLWSDEFLDTKFGYDEETNMVFWIGSDEDLASFDTTCQGLGGSTYLTSSSSDKCYYYFGNDDYFEDEEDSLVADWIRLPDCLPKTCASTKDAVDVLEKIWSPPNCDSLKIKLDIPNGCKDSGVKMLLKRDGVTKKRGCEWILRKEALREKRCGLKEVASHCPSTCNEVTTPNSCEEYSCEDSKMKWARWGKHDKTVLDCDWVKKNPDKRCKRSGVAATCRKTCGYKSDFLDCSS